MLATLEFSKAQRSQPVLVTRPSRSDWLSGVRGLQLASEPDFPAEGTGALLPSHQG